MRQRYEGVKAGAYTVPFRLRGARSAQFDFETALSIQANMVFGFGRNIKENSWLDFSWGLGLTKINLDEDNSNVTEKRTASALTTSFGAVIKPDRYVNVGVFLGWDFLGKQDRKANWIYNKKPWIGLGINISFDAITTDKTSNEETNSNPKK